MSLYTHKVIMRLAHYITCDVVPVVMTTSSDCYKNMQIRLCTCIRVSN